MVQPSRSALAALALPVFLAAPPALEGQVAGGSPASTGPDVWPVEVTPFVGAYVPLSQLARFSATLLILGVPARVTLEGKQRNAFAVGGRVSGWLGPRFGIEGTFSYAWSDLNVTRVIEIPGEVRTLNLRPNAAVWTATARLIARVARIDRSAALLIGAGPAIISRGGQAYQAPAFGLAAAGSVSGTTDVGGVFDMGVRIDAGSRVAIRLDAEAYLYSAALAISNPFGAADTPALESDSSFQADLLFSAGLAIGL